MTGGEGADRGCECVGYQCSCKGHEVPNLTMNNLVKVVRRRAASAWLASLLHEIQMRKMSSKKKGQLAFDFGQMWMKGQRIATGQANVKQYNRKLRDLIAAGKAKPSEIISHVLPLEQAAQGYKHFDERDDR